MSYSTSLGIVLYNNHHLCKVFEKKIRAFSSQKTIKLCTGPTIFISKDDKIVYWSNYFSDCKVVVNNFCRFLFHLLNLKTCEPSKYKLTFFMREIHFKKMVVCLCLRVQSSCLCLRSGVQIRCFLDKFF